VTRDDVSVSLMLVPVRKTAMLGRRNAILVSRNGVSRPSDAIYPLRYSNSLSTHWIRHRRAVVDVHRNGVPAPRNGVLGHKAVVSLRENDRLGPTHDIPVHFPRREAGTLESPVLVFVVPEPRHTRLLLPD
jgi:hypothetical protein